MRLVVADTGPLRYLILTGDIALLSTLFDRVLIPQTVRDELAHRNAPALVGGNGSLKLRLWLEVRPNPDRDSGDRMMVALDDGEQAAIALAVAVGADLVRWTIAKGSQSPAGRDLPQPARSAWWISQPGAA
jgi:predicted nucleic acid-binding protein